MGRKKCNKCGMDKLLSDFNRDKKNRDGHRNTCRECANKYNKQHSAANKEYYQEYYKEYNKGYYRSKVDRLNELNPLELIAMLSVYRTRKRKDGYMSVSVYPSPYYHRVLYCIYNNVTLSGILGQEIHHIDRNIYNNNKENLQLLSKEAHHEIHCT